MTSKSADIKDLSPIARPRSVAIIGASNNEFSVSGRPLKYLRREFKGGIYPVNPRYEEIQGLKCYPSIKDVPEAVDTALIAVSIDRLFAILEECAEKEVKSCIIVTSGFAEVSDETGAVYQKQLKDFIERTGMLVCGPNCIGMVNLPLKAITTFSPIFENHSFAEGNVALVSQSGALGHAMVTIASEAGIGFNFIISSGNEAGLTTEDYLEFLVQDPETEMILGYVEGFRDANRIYNIGSKARENSKPIIILKVGKSQVGQKAAMSHTAALTGSSAIYNTVFRQTGIIEAQDIDELVDYAVGFRSKKYPKGSGLAIVTASGGAGILMADKAEEYGLSVPELKPETRSQLEEIIPAFGSSMNPVDVTGQILNDTTMFKRCINILLKDPEIHMVVVMLSTATGSLAEQMANDIADVADSTDKPVMVIWSSGARFGDNGKQILAERKVPCYQVPSKACRVLAAMKRYQDFLDSKHKEPLINDQPIDLNLVLEILEQAPQTIGEYTAKRVLKQYGISVTKEEIAKNAEEAVSIARKIGGPVCLKIESPDILHKSEAKAIRLNLKSDDEIISAFNEIMNNANNYNSNAWINGVLVQEMITGGQEVIIGINNDPQFGPVILFGLGGIFVEILKDVSRRVLPLTKEGAYEMVKEIKAYPLLVGARGREKMDINAIVDTLFKVGQLAGDFKDNIAELDINPLLVLPTGQGVKVVDSIIIKKTK